MLPDPAPVWRLRRDRSHLSRVSMPVMPRQQGNPRVDISQAVATDQQLAFQQDWR